jgi:hypothetical protein
MNRMVLHSRVGADGVLHISVPMGESDAGRDVQVTIDPVGPSPMTQEEWRNFVLSTAGSVTGPSFVRHDQGEYEHRVAVTHLLDTNSCVDHLRRGPASPITTKLAAAAPGFERTWPAWVHPLGPTT